MLPTVFGGVGITPRSIRLEIAGALYHLPQSRARG